MISQYKYGLIILILIAILLVSIEGEKGLDVKAPVDQSPSKSGETPKDDHKVVQTEVKEPGTIKGEDFSLK